MSTFEKLNLMERETVGLYKKKLVKVRSELDRHLEEQKGIENFQRILSE